MTTAHNLLAKGYFPKELPPAFSTERFASYAMSPKGRKVLAAYQPHGNFTDCVPFSLAVPGALRRELGIPHPASFTDLALLTTKHFRRLLRQAGKSKFSKSRPVYSATAHRAFVTLFKPSNLARERAVSRGGGSYLVKTDISHFYPSLYTHAVGWAVNPASRHKKNWRNTKLLGKQLDTALMNMQGKVSQGIPIGNDVSYLLAEIVLGQVDRALGIDQSRAYRWFDDYEVSCDSVAEAETVLADLTKELRRFRLRLNQSKTSIRELPVSAHDEWQRELQLASGASFNSPNVVVAYFDTAFRLGRQYPGAAVMNYALGLLFRLSRPQQHLEAVFVSGISQALLAEPGVAQKAFSLLSFWILNGLALDRALLARTINQILTRHMASGVSSDVAWALGFCLEHRLVLSPQSAKILANCEDDCIALQALDCHAQGLLPRGFSTKAFSRLLKEVDLDGTHWLLGYEAARHGFLSDSLPAVRSNGLFSDLLAHRITFYRRRLPRYAAVIHPGGAPSWLVGLWLDVVRSRRDLPPGKREALMRMNAFQMFAEDVGTNDMLGSSLSTEETVASLLELQDDDTPALSPRSFVGIDSYGRE
ncbi:MAG: RNA-directed DNA polymerase [Vicinamibacterales bacterium]